MIGIVLISHGPLASGLLQAAEMIAGEQSQVAVLELQPAQEMDQFREAMEQAVARVDSGDGVLIVADLFGGSPANTSAYLLRPGVEVVCGANLPMLLEVLTLRDGQTLSELASEKVSVTFVPHLLPINRGIESTIYCRLTEGIGLDEVHKHYVEFYHGERFVRVMPQGSYAEIRNVRCSNFCDISLHVDARTHTLIISSVIDNMVKGAAGQAIQNMNIRFGLDEAAGLLVPPAII